MFDRWKLGKCIPSSLRQSISEIQSDFPQYGYIHQIFFHDPETANKISYPSKPFGIPLVDRSRVSKTSEFLSTLKSEDPIREKAYENDYHLDLNSVQFRILADPGIFLDRKKVRIYCYRRASFNEKLYQDRIRRAVVDPILEAGLTSRGPGGLFSLSPLAKTLGFKTSSLARLADYVLVGADDPRVLVVNGNYEAVVNALKTGILPTTTFETEETLLELSLLAGQTAIFQLLFEHFTKFNSMPTEKMVTKMLRLCTRHNLVEAAEYFLERSNDPAIIKEVLIYASENNNSKLIALITKKCDQTCCEFSPSDLNICIKSCLRNQNLEGLSWFLKEYSKIKIKYDPLHLKLLEYVIKYSPPESLQTIISSFMEFGYDISFLESMLNYSFDESSIPSFMLKYRDYYLSLSDDTRSKLPLQNWWKKIGADSTSDNF